MKVKSRARHRDVAILELEITKDDGTVVGPFTVREPLATFKGMTRAEFMAWALAEGIPREQKNRISKEWRHLQDVTEPIFWPPEREEPTPSPGEPDREK